MGNLKLGRRADPNSIALFPRHSLIGPHLEAAAQRA